MAKSAAIVMAAGKGTRMNSQLPKVLIPVAGRPMIEYVLDTLAEAGIEDIVVIVGYEADLVRRQLAGRPGVRFALQAEQLGTGHAVMMAREPLASHDGPVLVVAGDSPMLQAASVRKLLDEFQNSRPACLLGTAHKENPHGLGRIRRDGQQRFQGIVEEKDATEAERKITEVNLSTYVFDAQALFHALDAIRPNNSQGEYYLTDCPAVLLQEGRDVRALPVLQPVEALSINTPAELQAVEAVLQQRPPGQ